MANYNFRAPALPLSTFEYDQSQQDQFQYALRLYFNHLDEALLTLYGGGPFNFIDFEKTFLYTDQEARLGWNDTDKTLNLGMDYGVVQQIGQEQYARVRNSTGVTIPNGTPVGFAGAAPDALNVAPYIADGSQPTLFILGVMTHDLPDSGEKGYCTTFGFVRDLNTTGTPYGETWALGDVLYVSPTIAGGFTKVKPTAPNNVIPIAAVVQVGVADGVIFVRPTITQQFYYGTFSRTTDYTPAVADTAYAVEFTNTRIANGIFIGTPASRISVIQSGFYDISVTLQWSSTNASAKEVYGWIRKNGVDVLRSSRILTISGSGSYNPILISESVSLDANDYIEIMVATSNASVYLHAAPATAFSPTAPACNLVILQTHQ